jgi:hypothetical protein
VEAENMADDLDALRDAALREDDIFIGHEADLAPEVHSDRLFGMTPVERMFVSIGCFLATSLAGFLLLLVMEKIAL